MKVGLFKLNPSVDVEEFDGEGEGKGNPQTSSGSC